MRNKYRLVCDECEYEHPDEVMDEGVDLPDKCFECGARTFRVEKIDLGDRVTEEDISRKEGQMPLDQIEEQEREKHWGNRSR